MAPEVERDRKALKALTRSAQAELSRVFGDFPGPEVIAAMSDDEIVTLFNLIRDGWWSVADKYGTLAAALGQGQASMMLEGAGHRTPKLGTLVGMPDPSATFAALIDAMSQDDWQGACLRRLDGTIKTANTWSIVDVIEGNGAELIWHPSGTTTCRYCLQRASYGAYSHFRNEAQARGFATKPHDGCDCRPEVIPPDGTYPEDYHPSEYARQVQQMEREKAERAYDRKLDGWKTPGPKTRENVRRDRSVKAWGDRQRITAERDAAKKRLARARINGDTDTESAAREVLDRTAAERAALNGTTT